MDTIRLTLLVIFSIISCPIIASDGEINEIKCHKNQVSFEGKCIRLPKNAEPYDKLPGWRCKSGYTLGHIDCRKVAVPTHGTLSEDGITWTCNKGYKPYRGTCIKE